MKENTYKDTDINRWVYEKVPAKMELAKSEDQVKINTLILFESSFSSLAGSFIATQVNFTNIECVRDLIRKGRVYVKKSGV